jgi:hypothetical protein
MDASEKTTAAQKPEAFEGDSNSAANKGIEAILIIVRMLGKLSIGDADEEDIVQLA